MHSENIEVLYPFMITFPLPFLKQLLTDFQRLGSNNHSASANGRGESLKNALNHAASLFAVGAGSTAVVSTARLKE